MAHHANMALVVAALETAIQHTIDYHLSEVSEIDHQWIYALKPLCWCLLSLDSAKARPTIARQAFNKLMRTYGDILIGCWPPADEPSVPSQISNEL